MEVQKSPGGMPAVSVGDISETGSPSKSEIAAARDKLNGLIAARDERGIQDFFESGLPKSVMEDLTKTVLHDTLSSFSRADKDEKSLARMVQVLCDHLPFEALDSRNAAWETPLMRAAHKGQVNSMQVLLDAGASTKMTNAQGWSAFFYAAFSGAVDALMALLGYESSTGIDTRDDRGNTAFMVATDEGQLAAAQLLFQNGANINAKNHDGQNSLILCVRSSENNVLGWLIEQNVRLNDTDKDGKTALHYAVIVNDVDAFAALIKAGADPNIKDNTGQSPQTLVAGKRNEMENLLLEGRYQGFR